MHLSSLVLAAPLALASSIPRYGKSTNQQSLGTTEDFKCDLSSPLDPSGDGLTSAHDLFSTKAALKKQVERHSALVKVPAICYDDLGPFDEDTRWKPFYQFHDVLAETFPLM